MDGPIVSHVNYNFNISPIHKVKIHRSKTTFRSANFDITDTNILRIMNGNWPEDMLCIFAYSEHSYFKGIYYTLSR
jgi:hypothetical protein